MGYIMEKDKTDNIIYAGLLHDIGKLIQRANGFKTNHSICGVDYLKTKNNKLLKNEEILSAIKYHHAKYLKSANLTKDDIAYLIYEADNIASGTDRREDLEKEIDEDKSKWEKFDKSICLHSIFNLINKNEKIYGYNLRDLNENKNYYPKNLDKETIKATQDRYCNLKQTFDDNINSIKNENSLLELLEATTSFIPSSTNTDEVVDISLYDHSKLTAAIASCLGVYFDENNILDYKDRCFNQSKINEYRNEKYFLMVSLDLSGIQDFIYTVASEGALKSLRGRSFYLEILLEHIADEILEQLDFFRANILYTGGGHSYILLPNTCKTIELLENAKNKINDWFLKHFSTSLYLALAYQECSSNDLMNPKNKDGKRGDLTSKIFKNLSKKLSINKLKRYSEKQLEEIFEINPKDLTQIDRECKVCKNSSAELNEENVCKLCERLTKFGENLIKNGDWVIKISDKKEDSALEIPAINNECKYLYLTPKDIGDYAKERTYSLNKWFSGECFSKNLWVGNYVAKTNSDKVITFEDLAKSKGGVERIGILRADVDNLGTTFTSGFEQKEDKYQYVTISRYATLSRQLSMFFKHYINTICNNRNLAIIYSGGDDVFVAGAWSEVIDFALDLKEKFDEFTCNKLTFSAGIGFFTPSYPIYKMAESTGELEDLAKQNPQKNSVALFGKDYSVISKDNNGQKFVFNWNELKEIKNICKQIEQYCYFDENNIEQDKIFFSTALMYRIMTLIRSEKDINLARLAYTIARLAPGNKEEEKATIKYQNYKKLRELIYHMYQEDKIKLLTVITLLVYKYRNRR